MLPPCLSPQCCCSQHLLFTPECAGLDPAAAFFARHKHNKPWKAFPLIALRPFPPGVSSQVLSAHWDSLCFGLQLQNWWHWRGNWGLLTCTSSPLLESGWTTSQGDVGKRVDPPGL